MRAHGNPPVPDNNLGAANEVWQAITQLLAACRDGCGQILHAIKNGLIIAKNAVWQFLKWVGRGVWDVLNWVRKKILQPIALSGINLIGYLIDKVLFGSSGLRPYLQDGLLPAGVPDAWREWVRNNGGWDIYETMPDVLDNFLGLAGAGIGVVNILSHMGSAIANNTYNFYHLLGEYGIMGKKETLADPRNSVVKFISGVLTLPIVFPVVLVTNMVDCVFASGKQTALSFWRNLRSSYNLLGKNGVLGEHQLYEDDRNAVAKIGFGILSAPLVLPLIIITNTFDAVCTTIKHVGLSFWRNLRSSYNLLGKQGVLGERQAYEDDRHIVARIGFGILSAPLLVPIAIITNTFDALCVMVKHTALSFWRNLRSSYNLLGKVGVLGEHQVYEDDRHVFTKIGFGILSAPLLIPAAIITNTFDAICTTMKHTGLSFWRNLRSSYNLLGKHGVLDEHQPYEDDRHIVARIGFGILSAPLVLPLAVITNLFDAACVTVKHTALSFWRNLRSSYNLLGKHGVLGEHQLYNDDRHKAVRIGFGILSAPLVLPLAMITNLFDAACVTVKHTALSFWRNLRSSYNLLGKHGVLGEHQLYNDDRHKAVRIGFGILSAPLVLPLAMITNLFDAACVTVKHTALSFWRNLRSSYNLLGTYGVLGERQPYQDDRHKAVRIAFGILSAPLFIPTAIITNLFDVLRTTAKHTRISFLRNLYSSYNLLGKHGVLGEYQLLEDDTRNKCAKIGFGILSAPLFVPIALITNIFDALCTMAKHAGLSFWRNLRSSYNLLGKHGILGDHQPYQDDRHVVTRIGFGILSAPLLIPAALITNTFDALCVMVKHTALSFWRNLRSSYNLLGKYGILDEHQPYEDDRHIVARIGFGILSAPFLIPAAIITNTFDALCTSIKHTGLSFWRNLRSNYNLLGNYGVLGEHQPYEDDRHIGARIGFGILSAPLLIPVAYITNMFDMLCTIAKHTALSFWRNLRSSYNLLGKHGILDEHQPYEDDRHIVARIGFGILSTPLLVPAAIITNTFDALCTTIKHTALSFWRNLRSSYNLLGKHGILGEHQPYEDDRHIVAKIGFGILSAPLQVPIAIITNTFDALCTMIKHTGLSFWRNLRSSYNLLGKHGILGEHQPYEDDRHVVTKIGFGILSAPLQVPIAIITNTFDAICSMIKHTGLSFWRNLRSSYNLLGKDGVFGEHKPYEDDRHIVARIGFGILSAPLVVPVALVTNAIDFTAAIAKNSWLSFWHNIRCSFNLLGEKGVMGPHLAYKDERGTVAKVVYGVITSPLVVTAAIVTNAIDLVGAYFKNWHKTIKDPAILIAGVTTGVVAAIPAFMFRKTLKGIYNCTLRPVVDCLNQKPFNGGRIIKGIVNTLTLGGYSAVKKVFKVCTGYRDRFGFGNKVLPGVEVKEGLLPPTDYFNNVQAVFRQAIELATTGAFPGVEDGQGIFRPFMRVFYGMRHKVETIVKAFHDSYLKYAASLATQEKNNVAYSMHTFFASSQFSATKQALQANLREGEDRLLEKVQEHLCPSVR